MRLNEKNKIIIVFATSKKKCNNDKILLKMRRQYRIITYNRCLIFLHRQKHFSDGTPDLGTW